MKTILRYACTISLTIFVPSLAFAGEWSRVETSADPGARNGLAMAFDGARERVVLVGGYAQDGGARNDVWELEGMRWQQVSAQGGPSPRWNHALAFDGAGLLLVGGEEDSSGTRRFLGDAWRYEGNWSAAQHDDGPAPRARHALAYDAARDRVVLFGGAVGGDAVADTWEWDPSTSRWTERAVDGPGPRRDHALAFDGTRVILFGGLADGYQGDTWAYDGTRWEQISEAGPAPRGGHGMAGTQGLVVLFGGKGDNTIHGDTWLWNGQWRRVADDDDGPGRRFGHAMAWADDHVVLFGGNTPALDAQTWIYVPDADDLPGDTGDTGDDADTQGGGSGETEGGGDGDADGAGDGGCSCRLSRPVHGPWAAFLLVCAAALRPRRRAPRGTSFSLWI